MPRYTTRSVRPRADWMDDDSPLVPNLSVDDHEAVFTGLLDDKGEEIWRCPNPMGFGRDDEW
jgi:hypothetical protein